MKNINIDYLFSKYENEYKNEYNNDNYVNFHYGKEKKGGLTALNESLKLIGKGEITESDYSEESLMYKELMKNNTLILVVHANLKRSPYGGMIGYKYSISVYKNDPYTFQIGGGYGTSGLIVTRHTPIFTYDDYDKVHHNRLLISKICEYVKKYILENN